MKLIYGRTNKIVDTNMRDAQIGARKNKSVRNHLFFLNLILSDVMATKNNESIDINVLDLTRCLIKKRF